MRKLQHRKPRTGMSRPSIVNCNIRVEATLKRRIEKGAETLGLDFVSYVRRAVTEKLDRDGIDLSAEDYRKVAEMVAENERRQAEKLEKPNNTGETP